MTQQVKINPSMDSGRQALTPEGDPDRVSWRYMIRDQLRGVCLAHSGGAFDREPNRMRESIRQFTRKRRPSCDSLGQDRWFVRWGQRGRRDVRVHVSHERR